MIRNLTFAVVMLALTAGPALAAAPAEAGNGAEAAAPNPFAGDFGNALWTVIVFVLLLWVLGKFAWGPILSGLQSREQFIRESLEEAKENRDAAEARLKEYEEKLAGARDEVDEIMAEARRDASALREREEARAKEEAEKMLERARREISIAQETAVQDLYRKATALSTAAASRILEREISPQDHERLISDAIASVERMDGGGEPDDSGLVS